MFLLVSHPIVLFIRVMFITVNGLTRFSSPGWSNRSDLVGPYGHKNVVLRRIHPQSKLLVPFQVCWDVMQARSVYTPRNQGCASLQIHLVICAFSRAFLVVTGHLRMHAKLGTCTILSLAHKTLGCFVW
jgi:hypothetical protein